MKFYLFLVCWALISPEYSRADSEFSSLQGFLGVWVAKERQLPGPGGPGYEREGLLTETLGPGGHSHFIRYEIGPNSILAGIETVTFDPQAKKFIGYSFSDKGPGAFVTEGNWEGNEFVYYGQLNISGHEISVRKVLSEISKNAYTIRIYASIDGGPFQLATETKLKRK